MATSSESLGRRRWILLLALLLVVKGALVLSLADVFQWGEEFEKAAAAKAMLDGLDVPHHQLAYHYYEGGGFVASHLTAVAFLLVGENLLALKLVALGFQLALLVVGCSFTRDLFGARAGACFGLLFILGPESFQKLSLIDLGIHFEACLFLLGVLGLGARILFGGAARARDYLGLGLVAGFGVYYSYGVVLAAAWVGLSLALRRGREVFGRCGVAGLIGGVLGALPLIFMYAQVGDAVFDIHGASLVPRAGGPSNSMLLREFLVSVFVEGPFAARLPAWTWGLFFLGAAAFLCLSCTGPRAQAESSPRRGAVYVLGYLALFLVVYLASGFVQGRVYHYFLLLRLVPIWLFASVLIAGALGQLSGAAAAAPRRLAWVLGALLVALGLHASLAVVRGGAPLRLAENWHALTHLRGYRYAQYLAKVLPHFEGERLHKLELLEGFAERDRSLLRADAVAQLFGADFAQEVPGGPRVAHGRALELLRLVAGADEQRLADYRLGLGGLLVQACGWDRQAAFEAALGLPPAERPAGLEALGRFGGAGYPLPGPLGAEVARAQDVPEAQAFLRGLGRWTFSLHWRQGPEELLASYPEPVARALRAGFEAERAGQLAP